MQYQFFPYLKKEKLAQTSYANVQDTSANWFIHLSMNPHDWSKDSVNNS